MRILNLVIIEKGLKCETVCSDCEPLGLKCEPIYPDCETICSDCEPIYSDCEPKYPDCEPGGLNYFSIYCITAYNRPLDEDNYPPDEHI